MPQSYKLGEIKNNIQNVLENVDLLEALSNSQPGDLDVDQLNQLEECTTILLTHLEKLPCKQIARTQLQRQRRRRKVKQKAKLQKLLNKTAAKHSNDTAIHSICNEESALPQKQAEHITLKKLHDADNILYTLDLLERLYKARGGGDEDMMANKLRKLRTIWQRVRHESKSASTLEINTNFDTQWARAIFGNSAENLEQGKLKTKELLERRIIWDSYINYDKSSSCIPLGWVLPPEDPQPEWSMFKCE